MRSTGRGSLVFIECEWPFNQLSEIHNIVLYYLEQTSRSADRLPDGKWPPPSTALQLKRQTCFRVGRQEGWMSGNLTQVKNCLRPLPVRLCYNLDQEFCQSMVIKTSSSFWRSRVISLLIHIQNYNQLESNQYPQNAVTVSGANYVITYLA